MPRRRANLLLLMAAALWGTGNVAQKTILADLGPCLTFGLRGLIGLLVIAPWLGREIRTSTPIGRKAWGGVATASAAFCGAVCLNQVALVDTTVTSASFLVNTTVLFSPLLGWLLLGERPGLLRWSSVGLASFGIVLMSNRPGEVRWGDLLCVISALFYSLWIVLVARVARLAARPFTLAAGQFALAGVVGIVAGALLEHVSVDGLLGGMPELLFLGVLSTGAGFTLQAVAQRWTPVVDAAVIMSAESVFGAVAAMAVLGETMTASEGLGAAVILSAGLLLQVPGARRSATTAPRTRDASHRADHVVAAREAVL